MKELLDNPIQFFPYYFKEHDSYKELSNDGKGLFERFLNICTEYLRDYPKADIDNFLEILDISKTSDIYINNFWKFFGELPFAKGPIINPELFNKTFTGFNLEEALNIATVSREDITGISHINYRDALKYAVALFKIRGTLRFFRVMFRLYGITAEIITSSQTDPFIKTLPLLDDEYNLFDSDVTFDNQYTCHKCSEVIFIITLPNDLKISSDTRVNTSLEYINQVRAFIERFVPFYIKPLIQVKDRPEFNQVTISLDSYHVDIPEGSFKNVEVTVEPLLSGNKGVSTDYQVAITDGAEPQDNQWSLKRYTEKIFKLRVPGKTYWFKPVAMSTPRMAKVSTGNQYTETQYTIWISTLNGIPIEDKLAPKILSQDNPEIDIIIKALKRVTTYRDGEVTGTFEDSYPQIFWENQGITLNQSGASGVTTTVTTPGNQIFRIKEFIGRKTEIYIGISDDYLNTLGALQLSLQPQKLLIVEGRMEMGSSIGSDISKLKPGVYALNDNSLWVGSEFKTQFNIINPFTGEENTQAYINQIGNSLKEFKTGDYFVPPTTSSARYQFVAKTPTGFTSNQVILEVIAYAKLPITPVYSGFVVEPKSVTLFDNGPSTPPTVKGSIIINGLTRDQALSWSPSVGGRITKYNSNTDEWDYLSDIPPINTQLVEDLGYVNKQAFYEFEYILPVNTYPAGTKLRYTFYPVDNEQASDTTLVNVIKDNTTFYILPEGNIDQWSGMKDPASGNDNLTFTANRNNDTAAFYLGGTYRGKVIGSDGKNYLVDTDGTNLYQFKVKGNKTITFTAEDTGKVLTLKLEDYESIVSIQCEPTSGEITPEKPEAVTIIRGSTNRSDTFKFTLNGDNTIYETANGLATEGFKFIARLEGKYIFTAYDDPTKMAIFQVGRDEVDPNTVKITANPSPNSSSNPFKNPIQVSLTPSISDWEIWYYFGSEQGQPLKQYTDPIELAINTTIIAKVKSPQGEFGPEIEFPYFFEIGVEPPLRPDPNTFNITVGPEPPYSYKGQITVRVTTNPVLPSSDYAIMAAVTLSDSEPDISDYNRLPRGNIMNIYTEGDNKLYLRVWDTLEDRLGTPTLFEPYTVLPFTPEDSTENHVN